MSVLTLVGVFSLLCGFYEVVCADYKSEWVHTCRSCGQL